MEGKGQQVFIVGAPKCGTTMLFEVLSLHPEICGATPKETGFLEFEHHHGLQFYRKKYYSNYRGEKYFLDGRPSNLFLPYVPARAESLFPDAKFIVMVRDPARRAFSHWWMRYSRGFETLSFSDAIEKTIRQPEINVDDVAESERLWLRHRDGASGRVKLRTYLEMGHYAQQIKRYHERFGRERVLVIALEHLQQVPAHEHARLERFLELARLADFLADVPVSAVRNNEAVNPLEGRAIQLARRVTLGRLVPQGLKASIKDLLRRTGSPPKLEAVMHQQVLKHFQASDRELAALMGWDECPWRAANSSAG